MQERTSCCWKGIAIIGGAPLWAALAWGGPANSEVRSLAATCAACHGTDGHAVGAVSMRLAGLPKADLVREMRAFRGSDGAGVMQQIARGYSDAQIEALGDFFAAQPEAPP